MACAFGNFAFSLLPACALLVESLVLSTVPPCVGKSNVWSDQSPHRYGWGWGFGHLLHRYQGGGVHRYKVKLCTPTWDLSLSCVIHIRPVKL